MVSIFRSLSQTATPFVGKAFRQNLYRPGNSSLHGLNSGLTAMISQPLAVGTNRSLKGRAVVARGNEASLHKFFSKGEGHGSSSGLWPLGALGAFLLAASIVQSVADCEGNKRIMSVNVLPANKKLNLLPKGLIDDPEHKGWFKIKDSKSLFRAKLTPNGQLIWKSFAAVGESDVKGIADFYRNSGHDRSLHINTGIHGDTTGQAGVDHISGTFAEEDIYSLKGYQPVSFHIVSSFSGPITEKEIRHVDILDAWCFSASTKDFSKLNTKEKADVSNGIKTNSVPRYQLMGCFMSAQDLGHPSTLVTNVDYTEMGSLKKDVVQRLKEDSFCYVRGIGGLGKSRVALEIEREIGNKIDQSKSEYDTTVFVSLKSDSLKNEFLGQVREKVSEKDDDIALKKYFSRLGDLARAHSKKIFVVVDNIDTDDDFKFLQDIFDNIEKFHKPNEDSTFKLLVTGRLSPLDFLTKNKLDKLKDRELTIAKYCTVETCWSLVVNSFSEVIPEERKQKGKIVIEQKKIKEDLLNFFKKLDYHPAVVALFGRTLGQSYKLGKFDADMRSLSARFQGIIALEGGLSDYGLLTQAVEAQLGVLDTRLGGKASKIFEIFSLTSDGPISYRFFSDILKKYYNSVSDVEFDNVFCTLESCGLVQEVTEGVYQMPPFYHTITQLSLTNQYKKNGAGDIDEIFSTVLDTLDTIEKNQEKNTGSTNTLAEHVMHLVGLFNSARHILKVDQPLYDKISSKCAVSIAKGLSSLKFEDVQGKFNNLLFTLSDRPGYSLDPVLHRFIKGQELEIITNDLIRRANELILEEKQGVKGVFPTLRYGDIAEPLLVSLNNLYVIYRESKQDSLQIEEILGKLIAKWDDDYIEFEKLKNNIKSKSDSLHIKEIWNDLIAKADYENSEFEKLKDISISNIKNPKMDPQKLVVLPGIKFNKVSDEYLRKAQEWKKKNSLDKKEANLSRAELGDGLRIFIPYLNGVEVVDLSHNSLGDYANAAAVRDLLKFPGGSLKELRLNNNTLRSSGFGPIISGLKQNTSLEKLILNNNSLEDVHVKKLCDALRNHRKIKHIELHHNKFTQTGIEHLVKLMEDNPNIQSITTRNYFINRHIVKELLRDPEGKIKKVV